MASKLVISLLLFAFLPPTLAQNGLRVGFYDDKCPQAESIVRGVTTNFFQGDKSIPAGLLRMHFHDCFVRGCDASILIDATGDNVPEKEAIPNQSVRGFDIIDEAKALVEKICPGVVSCADIIALATRDGVALAGGPQYSLPTGRRDGKISLISNVNLPSPTSLVSDAAAAFSAKGLDISDMVTLLGAHTVGNSLCSFFSDRLFNFQGSGKPDPSMDPTLVVGLKNVCPSTSSNSTLDPNVFLDQNTSFTFDNSFYKQLQLKHGILQIDQELAFDNSTKNIVASFAANESTFRQRFVAAVIKLGILQIDQELAFDNSTKNIVASFAGNESTFRQRFVAAIIKLGNTEVLTGNNGEIRSNCRLVN